MADLAVNSTAERFEGCINGEAGHSNRVVSGGISG